MEVRFHVAENGTFAWCTLPGGWYEVRLQRHRRSWLWTLVARRADGTWGSLATGSAATRDEAAEHGLAACGARGRVVFDDDAAPSGAGRC
jgi:hypothetical protein